MSREEKRYLIEVHVAGTCFRKKNGIAQVLVAKRSQNKELYPGKWECGGGQIHFGENFKDAVKREMKEEFGVIVKKVIPFSVYSIPVDKILQKKIPGLRCICEWDGYVNGKGPKIDPKDFSEWRWQPISKLDEIDFISGIAEDTKRAWENYSMEKNCGKINKLIMKDKIFSMIHSGSGKISLAVE